jgi:hypothetical protein
MQETIKTLSGKASVKQFIKDNRLENLRRLGLSDYAIIIIYGMEKAFKNNPEGFYRHGNDCSDQLNLDGKCWVKELGISKSTFKKYFKEIGICHNSPEDYSSARWKFFGRFYCSVYDEFNHKRTKYYRNNKLAGLIEAVLNIDYSQAPKNLGLRP